MGVVGSRAGLIGRHPAAAHESGVLRLVETAPILPLRELKEQCEKEYIESVLRRTSWNFVQAARRLHIQRALIFAGHVRGT